MTRNSQADVIAFLSDPAAYGTTGPVERIETHISVVFLAGERAYKLKRAVRFPYLDYTDPAARRRFCHREVEINRRTAPEIYETVLPVVRTPQGSLALGVDGQEVDWLVVMKRFGQDSLWDAIARRGGLTPPMVNRLADAIARFHAGAAVHRDRGGAAPLRRIIGQSEAELRAHVPAPFDFRAAAAFGETARAMLDRIADLLDRRAAEGSVRHCHGDLHLRNICQFDGEPTLFDAIEFSDDIAIVDVLYDLAFLIMDMEHRGLGALANLLLNRYLSATRDYDGLAAMPLFLSLRAAIRAHVTAAAAGGDGEAGDYLALALALLEPATPSLIATGGYSGSGKSTLARALAPGIGPAPGAVHLQSDTIRKRMAGVSPETRLAEEHYSEEVSERVYARIRQDAARALAAGYSVIADATYLNTGERRRIEAVAEEAGVAFVGLWLDAPRETMEERLAARRGDASDAVVRVLHSQLESGPANTGWRAVEAAGDVAAARRAAERILNREGIVTRRASADAATANGWRPSMALKRIRLELARNEDFPEGSPSHGYEVTLPLTEEGRFDSDEFATDGQLCTFFRFAHGERDRRGQVVLNEAGQWAFSYELGDLDDELVFKLDSRLLRPDEFLTVTHVDGREHVYRIVSVGDLRFPQPE